MIIDFNRYNGGGGSGSGSTDLTNYWNSAVTEQHIESAATEVYSSAVSYTDAALADISLDGYYTSAQTESAITEAVAGKADAKTMVDFDHTTQAERAAVYAELKALYDGGSGATINKNYDFYKTVNTWQGLKIDYYGFSGDTLVFGKVVSPENLTDQVVYEQVMVIDSLGNVAVVTNTVGGGADMSEYYTSAQTDEAIAQAVSGLATEQYVQDALSGVNLDNYWTSAQTEEKIASAVTPVAEHLAEVEQVASSGYNELHTQVLELSARTPDLSAYYTSAQTEEAITSKNYVNSGQVKSQVEAYGYATVDQLPVVPTSNTAFTNDAKYVNSAETKAQIEAYNYVTSAETKAYVDSAVTGVQDQIDTMDEVVSQALVDLDGRVDAISAATPDLSPYWTSAQTENALSSALIPYYTSAQTNTAISAATQNMVISTDVRQIVKLTQSAYDQLTTKDPYTFYIIVNSN